MRTLRVLDGLGQLHAKSQGDAPRPQAVSVRALRQVLQPEKQPGAAREGRAREGVAL